MNKKVGERFKLFYCFITSSFHIIQKIVNNQKYKKNRTILLFNFGEFKF